MRAHRLGSGFSLLEVTVSLALLALMVFPLLFLQLRGRESVGLTSRLQRARVAVEAVVERMRAQATTSQNEFAALANDWSGAGAGAFTVPWDAATDAPPGSAFFVEGLPSRGGDPGLPHGEIELLLDEREVGLDLDADGTLEALQAADRYRVLPVRLRVWWGSDPDPKVERVVLISQRSNFRRQRES